MSRRVTRCSNAGMDLWRYMHVPLSVIGLPHWEAAKRKSQVPVWREGLAWASAPPPNSSNAGAPIQSAAAPTGIPGEVQFATKPTPGGEMITAALDAGTTASWVTGDEAYGRDPRLRARPAETGIGSVMAVACSTRVRIDQGRTPVRADTLAGRLPMASWQRHSAGRGAKGPRHYDWAWIHIGTSGHRHLLIRRNRTTGELAFHLCRSPTQVPLSDLVRVAGIRWSVEECFQAAKGQVGLDHHQVRNRTSWRRHITLAMLALAFLTVLAADAAPDRAADPHHPPQP